MRTSTDDGATWTAPVRVNDDATTNSQFLPTLLSIPQPALWQWAFMIVAMTTACPVLGGTNMIPNDDAEYYGTSAPTVARLGRRTGA
jgi:hypothetical protein